eukprot:jgi/Hompol1/4677/HPOL_000799-RA
MYCVTAHKPDSVSAAVSAEFTGPNDLNLIVSKCTHFELYLLVEHEQLRTDEHGAVTAVVEKSLKLVMDVPIFGRIASMFIFRPKVRALASSSCKISHKHSESKAGGYNRETDLLFICTERYKMLVLSFDADRQKLVTEATCDVRDIKARPADGGQMAVIDPRNRMIALHISQASIKIIPMFHPATEMLFRTQPQKPTYTKGKAPIRDSRRPAVGEFGEAFSVNLEELHVLSIAMLDTEDAPTLAVLHQDTKECRYIVQYEITLRDKRMERKRQVREQDRQEKSDRVDRGIKTEMGALFLIPVPEAAGGGVLVVGEKTIVLYFSKSPKLLTLPMSPNLIKCYVRLDREGTRYLLGDYLGGLHLLNISQSNDGTPIGLSLTQLGQTTQPSCLAFLADGYFYVGSHFGDSELHVLLTNASEISDNTLLRETFPNLSPIIDFCVVDIEKQGQDQIVACCGAQKDSSLRIIRNGIGVEEIGQLDDMQELTGVWALRPHYASRHDHLLVLSFIGETRFQQIDGEALEEVDGITGFRTQEGTLCCGNLACGLLAQVTPSTVVLVAPEGMIASCQWSPPDGSVITKASMCDNYILLSIGGQSLALLEVVQGDIIIKSLREMERDISCLNIAKLDHLSATLCAVGFWGDCSVRLMTIPNLQDLCSETLSEDVISRSVLLVEFEDIPYLLVSLGDGQLFNFHITKSKRLANAKKITLGTQPITLRTFQSNGRTHVFAASDRPTVIHAKSGQLLYSNVNMREVSQISPFNTAVTEGALALACEGSLKIGVIETVQKLHIKTVKVLDRDSDGNVHQTGETIRRITYHLEGSCFGIIADGLRSQLDGLLKEVSYLRILDSLSFEMLDKFELNPYEIGFALTTAKLSSDPVPYLVVGTGYALPHEDEPTRGRILVFSVTPSRRIRLVHEYEIRGCALDITVVQSKLIAAVNSKILVLEWNSQTSCLELESTNFGHVLACSIASRGDFVLVGDLMKSVSLFNYNPESKVLEEVARDFDSNWMTSVEAVDDDLFIGADNHYNLFTLRKQADAETEEERGRLRPVGYFHLGELVNRFRKGSLTMKNSDGQLPATPELLYCTVNGSIGVIASLAPETFVVLNEMQEAMRFQIQGVGGLVHSEWRTFQTDRKSVTDAGFIDGDLIEMFLELPRMLQDQVAATVINRIEQISTASKSGGSTRVPAVPSEPITYAYLCKLVEDLTRIH